MHDNRLYLPHRDRDTLVFRYTNNVIRESFVRRHLDLMDRRHLDVILWPSDGRHSLAVSRTSFSDRLRDVIS